MRLTKFIIEPPEDKVRILDIYKFAVTVEIGAIKLYMRMNMNVSY